MLSVALTGNIAAGKSAVVDLFRKWGATIIDADQLVREAQRPGTEVLQAITFRFGRDVVLPGGELDRAALRGKVMGDDRALAELNAIVHPAIHRERDRLLAEARARGDRVVVSDIPLLFEVADPSEFDAVVLVDAPDLVRLNRLVKNRDLDPEEALRMMQSQRPALAKRRQSDFVIDNDGTLEELEEKARLVWTELEKRSREVSS